MILGNSHGQNTGKKYMCRKSYLEYDELFAEQAEHFNIWFTTHFVSISEEMKTKNMHDEDVLNDTYLRIYEKILFTGEKIKNYRSYLFRALFSNMILDRQKQNRYCELQQAAEREELNAEYYNELEEKKKKLEEDVLTYVYRKYKIREFELFKMYMNLKPAINYTALENITNIQAHIIQQTVSKIKKDVRNHPEFLKRRKEVL